MNLVPRLVLAILSTILLGACATQPSTRDIALNDPVDTETSRDLSDLYLQRVQDEYR